MMKLNKFGAAPARQGACVVGRSKLKDTDTISYALDLNETNVQAIFNRCIAKEGTLEDQCFNSILFSRLRGYSPDAERIVVFNRENFLANKKYIQYLYGQLKNVHAGNKTLQINEAFLTYSGMHWTTNKGVLLEFLYLGATNDGHALISIFDARTDFGDKPNSAFLSAHKPTLSPKDPAFPAWWEQHKAEWES